jgi:hypothetical protein
MPQLPNFMILGAAKAGTSSLWAYLNQHPEVFLARNKEPNFFALAATPLPEPGPAAPERLHELLYSYTVTDFNDYTGLFEAPAGARAIGEASVRYLYTPGTAARIRACVPDARLVILLRDPVTRLYSHYCMNRQYGLEPLALLDAVAREDERVAARWGYDWHYTRVSRYSSQLLSYLAEFPREQVGIFLYEDFARNPVKLVQEICGFLEVDRRFVPDVSLRMKGAYRPRSHALDGWINPPGREGRRRCAERFNLLPAPLRRRILGALNRLNRAPVAPLAAAERRELRSLFSDEIERTSELLGRRLGW